VRAPAVSRDLQHSAPKSLFGERRQPHVRRASHQHDARRALVDARDAHAVRYRPGNRDRCADHVRTIQQQLLRDDAYLIGLANADPDDLARTGRASATSTWKPTATDADAFCHHDFAAANVLSGIGRPEKGKSSNLWVSDPSKGLPQELTVELGRPADIGKIDLRFDTDLDTLHFSDVPGTCVRDYTLEVRSEGTWRRVHAEKGNAVRRRVHDIAPVTGDAVRLRVAATHGDPAARVYEVRVYPPGK